MTGMDGFEATEPIRRQELESGIDATPRRTPIIAVTASATSRDRERRLEAGMDDYISKPIDIVALDLALTVGAIELMRLQKDLTPNALMLLRQAESGLNAADHHLRSLQKVVRVRTKQTPVSPALDLARSTAHCG